jgi:hypothetical protein
MKIWAIRLLWQYISQFYLTLENKYIYDKLVDIESEMLESSLPVLVDAVVEGNETTSTTSTNDRDGAVISNTNSNSWF